MFEFYEMLVWRSRVSVNTPAAPHVLHNPKLKILFKIWSRLELCTQRSGKMLHSCVSLLSESGCDPREKGSSRNSVTGNYFNGNVMWDNLSTIWPSVCFFKTSCFPALHYKLSDSVGVAAPSSTYKTLHYFQGKLANFTKITIEKSKTQGWMSWVIVTDSYRHSSCS